MFHPLSERGAADCTFSVASARSLYVGTDSSGICRGARCFALGRIAAGRTLLYVLTGRSGAISATSCPRRYPGWHRRLCAKPTFVATCGPMRTTLLAPSASDGSGPFVEDVFVDVVWFSRVSPPGEVPSVSANAIPGVFAIAAPTPNVTASAPTRPMCLAYPIGIPFRVVHRPRYQAVNYATFHSLLSGIGNLPLLGGFHSVAGQARRRRVSAGASPASRRGCPTSPPPPVGDLSAPLESDGAAPSAVVTYPLWFAMMPLPSQKADQAFAQQFSTSHPGSRKSPALARARPSSRSACL